MLVGISSRDRTVTSVVYGTDALELVGSETSNNDAYTYIYKLVSPPSGTDDVVVTFTGGNLANDRAGIVGVMTFSNVDQNNPLGAYADSAGNNTTPVSKILSTTTSNLVVNVLAVTDASTITLNSGQTERWGFTGIRPIGYGYTAVGATGSTTLTYTLGTSRRWSLSGVAINPVPIADLQITKTVDNSTPYIGQTIVFTLTATNNGPGLSNNTAVQDLLPSGYIYSSHSTLTGTYSGGSGFWDIGTLNSGSSAVLTIDAVVAGSGSYSNSATITGDVIDNDSGNNTAIRSITVCQAGGTQPLFSN
ncbi:MAG TPA: DUF11 domain-containing protein [Bacteroidales bacterium]|nr:DUF11 domain-containing protein [Bacteroidales bacterium]